jgi:threonyl-tRNA synthetase
MKIITLHCDYIKFKALKKAVKDAEELPDKDEKEIKECLVVLTAVEKGDSPETLNQLIEAIEKTAKEVKTSSIVLYPYAHLSSNLAPPKVAQEYLQNAESLLKKNKSFKSVVRAPFGYYKSFELKVKGHPLSELSKTFSSQDSSSPEEIEEDYDIKKLLSEVSRTKLDTSKLKDNDHRILAQKLDLFSFNESAPGSVFWHDNGLYIYNKLVEYWRNVHRKAGYQEISTPQIVDNKLWKISGHWKLYKDNLFITNREGREFALKPMNCPGGMMVYKSQPKSYKDLPLRLAELGKVHRLELSGVISGIFRVFQFTQDDAHIFVSEKQLQTEILNVIKLFKEMLDIFNFKYNFTLSVRSKDKKDKYLGSDKLWDSAEQALTDGLNKLKIKYSKEQGEAKFYGPSLDVVIKDSLGREWQCSTLQLDFNLPERFDLEYIDKDNKPKRPIILHRVVYGSLERFIGVLLEHTNGNLPLWLSPRQVRVISFTDRNIKATEKLVSQLKESLPGLRIDSDNRSETVQSKIRDAEMLKINYIIVIGDKEEKSKNLAVRPRGEKPKFDVSFDNFIKDMKKELSEHN